MLAPEAGCGGGGDGIEYEGTPGTPVEARLDALVPTIPVVLNGGEPQTFLVDTGAPLTIVNALSFPGRPDGKAEDDIDAFELSFPGYTTATWAIFDPASGLAGIIGGDLLRHFAFSIDYRDSRVWLSDPFDPALEPSDLQVGPELAVPMSVEGGGRALIPGCGSPTGCGTINLPPTRVIMQATFEDRTEPVYVLIDSGASAVVIDQAYLENDLDPGGRNRPRLDGITVGTVNGNVDGYMTRVWRVDLHGEGADLEDPHAIVDDVPALVIPGTTLLVSISSEVDVPIRALIGGSYLRRFKTTFDYQEERMRLAPYLETDHIRLDEYVSVGFQVLHWGEEYLVGDVYPGSDADAEGLVEGAVIEELGGTAVTGLDESSVNAILGQYGLGEELPVGIMNGVEITTYMVLVEDLLPSFPAP
jgi:predicted aspartyl protease